MSKELLSCPFCGGEGTEHSRCNYEETAGEIMFFVRCKNCGVETSWQYKKEKAIDLWNTRKPIDSIVEQLENMTTVCSAGTIINGAYIGRNSAINIVRKGGVNE